MLKSDVSAAIVAEARSWVGTPYAHQGRQKGWRVDCVGLIIEVGRALEIGDFSDELFQPFIGYTRQPNPRRMGTGMAQFLRPLDLPANAAAPDGSIAWIYWKAGMPMHLAIMATFKGRRTMIHAYQSAERCVEHGFVGEWCERVHSWWAYPGSIEDRQ